MTKLQHSAGQSANFYTVMLSVVTLIVIMLSLGRIFSCVKPFYERAVSDLGPIEIYA